MPRYLGQSQELSQGTQRQRAFQDSINQMSQGLTQYGNVMDQKAKVEKQDAATKRQLALQEQNEKMGDLKTSIQLTKESGQPVTSEMVRDYRTGANQLGPDEMGPEAPSGLAGIFEGIQAKQLKAQEAAGADRSLNTRFKEAQINKMGREAKVSPKMGEREKMKFASKLRREEAKLKKQEGEAMKKDPSYILSKMGAEAKNKVGSIASGMQAIASMGNALKSGHGPEYLDVNTPMIGGLMSDTPYTKSERVLSEVVGRLQSGGAINAEEGKRFLAMGPRAGDSKKIAEQKIDDQKMFLHNKLTAYGIKPEQLEELGFSVAGTEVAPTEGVAEDIANGVMSTATAASPEEAFQKAKTMSVADKVKFLQGQ